ncbi:MAG: replicative DNA helicase [Oscillospiraceae bacterium]|nr:replicative DNA helicase [Oscillospiraceae bacterium]
MSEINFTNPAFEPSRIPYSLEAEMSVLGAVLIKPEIYEEIAEILLPEDFYLDSHRQIYDAITDLYLRNRSLDLVTLLEDIVAKSQRGGESVRNTTKETLMHLADSVPVIDNVKEYAEIVKEKSLRRKLIAAANDIIGMAHESSASSDILIDRAQQLIFALAQGQVAQELVHIKHVIVGVFDQLHKVATDKEAARGLTSGFSGIDNVLVGMNPGNLVLIGARPSMGKTAFAMNIAMNVAAKKRAVAFFQLEMSREEVVSRLLSSESFVDNYKLRSGILNDEEWTKIAEAAERVSHCDIYLDDTPNITVTGMKAKLRRLKKLDLVVIDHLQLMQADRGIGNKVQEISEISRNLKIMAKELGVPVIICSQLNRGPESRDDKRPMLSDLRESGAIEQDADIVMFLYRDDYYKESVDKHNRAEIIFAKNRHGSIGKIEVGFEKKYTRFYDIDDVHKE